MFWAGVMVRVGQRRVCLLLLYPFLRFYLWDDVDVLTYKSYFSLTRMRDQCRSLATLEPRTRSTVPTLLRFTPSYNPRL